MSVQTFNIDASLGERIKNLRLVAFDFDGVFTDNSVYVAEDGSESVRCVRSDGLGLQKLAALGIQTIIISTESNPVVTARSGKLKIRCIQDCSDKRRALETVMRELAVSKQQTAFVGNDINDIPALELAGVPIVVADAHADVVQYAAYRTRLTGGYGAVREVCDLIAAVFQK